MLICRWNHWLFFDFLIDLIGRRVEEKDETRRKRCYAICMEVHRNCYAFTLGQNWCENPNQWRWTIIVKESKSWMCLWGKQKIKVFVIRGAMNRELQNTSWICCNILSLSILSHTVSIFPVKEKKKNCLWGKLWRGRDGTFFRKCRSMYEVSEILQCARNWKKFSKYV